MLIKSRLEHRGKTYDVQYHDGLPQDAEPLIPDAVHAFCFYDNKLVIVKNEADGLWTPPGGSIEKGETYEEAAVREVKEEANMKVLHMETLGYQDVEIPWENRTVRQFRVFCIVEPYGDFESDPDGDISEIKLIESEEYGEYVLWEEIGGHLMQRAMEKKESFDSK